MQLVNTPDSVVRRRPRTLQAPKPKAGRVFAWTLLAAGLFILFATPRHPSVDVSLRRHATCSLCCALSICVPCLALSSSALSFFSARVATVHGIAPTRLLFQQSGSTRSPLPAPLRTTAPLLWQGSASSRSRSCRRRRTQRTRAKRSGRRAFPRPASPRRLSKTGCSAGLAIVRRLFAHDMRVPRHPPPRRRSRTSRGSPPPSLSRGSGARRTERAHLSVPCAYAAPPPVAAPLGAS